MKIPHSMNPWVVFPMAVAALATGAILIVMGTATVTKQSCTRPRRRPCSGFGKSFTLSPIKGESERTGPACGGNPGGGGNSAGPD
jgi:hypothetical protein